MLQGLKRFPPRLQLYGDVVLGKPMVLIDLRSMSPDGEFVFPVANLAVADDGQRQQNDGAGAGKPYPGNLPPFRQVGNAPADDEEDTEVRLIDETIGASLLRWLQNSHHGYQRAE